MLCVNTDTSDTRETIQFKLMLNQGVLKLMVTNLIQEQQQKVISWTIHKHILVKD